MSKHTPGPWTVDFAICPKHNTTTTAIYARKPNNHIIEIVEAGCKCGDQAIHGKDSKERTANAILIAAAPAFKKALDMLLRATVDDDLKHGIGLTEAEQEARQFALDLFAYVEDGSGEPPWEPKSKENNKCLFS